MSIRCTRCHIELVSRLPGGESTSADPALGPGRRAIRCSVCDHVFFVELERKPWQVRTVEGTSFTAPDLDTLRTWIVEGRLHPDDEFSRGENWVRLGDIAEFSDAFVGFESLPRMLSPVDRAKDGSAPHAEPGACAQTPATREAGNVRPVTRAHGPVHAPVHAGGSSRPRTPTSMLAAVTEHVRQEPEHESSPEPDASREASIASSRSDDASQVPPRPPIMRWLAPRRSSRRAGQLKIAAAVVGLSLGSGIALIVHRFGEPSEAATVTVAEGAAESPSTPDDAAAEPSELQRAREALRIATAGAIGEAEAALQAQIDAGNHPESVLATMQLLQVELLSTRALVSWIAAQLDGRQAATLMPEVEHDTERAGEILARLDTRLLPDRERVRAVRALHRCVSGRPAEEIRALLAGTSYDELALVVEAVSVLRQPEAAVSPEVIERLASLQHPEVPTRLTLLLAHVRAGRDEAAHAVAQTLAEHPIARRWLAGAASDAADDVPAGDQDPTDIPIDRLIESGCEKVESGVVRDGIALLQRAERARPHDIDVALCLGQAQMRLAAPMVALRHYDKALERSPRLQPALLGAARAAAKAELADRAAHYYQRLLELDPNGRHSAEARAHLEE